ncbi:MAG: hypothetical protein LAT84_01210 [Balneolia bacterium]|nr:hypothetical protein [Balneolia bacterium]
MLKKSIIIFIICLVFAACERFPGHYVALNQCLQENTAVGEEILVAFAELEEYLLDENLLEGTQPSNYASLLTAVAEGRTSLSAHEVAPRVRDFWGIQEAATFGAYMRCGRELSENMSAGEASSIHRMHEVYTQMMEADDFDSPEHINALIDAISEDDFRYLLYRSAVLTVLVYMMES